MKMKLGLLILLVNLIHSEGRAQEIWKHSFEQNPSSFSVDTEGHIYVGFEDGSMNRYAINSSEIQPFSLPNQSSISLIEAQNNRKIFLFYRDNQQIVLLDRFTTIPKSYQLPELGIEYAQSACMAPDGTFWIVETNPQRIKKIDPLRNVVIHEVQHQLGDSISMMRVDGSLLIISDEQGIHVLDPFGNIVSSYELKGISYFHVFNQQLVITASTGLYILDLRNSAIIEQLLDHPFREKNAIIKYSNAFVIIGKQRMRKHVDDDSE